MTSVLYCQACENYRGMGRCLAFPGGIPHDVLRGEKEHDQPIKGDHGIRFAPIARADEG